MFTSVVSVLQIKYFTNKFQKLGPHAQIIIFYFSVYVQKMGTPTGKT